MKRANVLQEVRQMRIEELYAGREQRTVTMAEAAEILGVTERTFPAVGGATTPGGQDRQLRRPSRRFPRSIPYGLWCGREPGTAFIP